MDAPNPHAVALGRLGGLAGYGKSKARPHSVAQAAANARWKCSRCTPIFSDEDKDLLLQKWRHDRYGYCRYSKSSSRSFPPVKIRAFLAHRVVCSRMVGRALNSKEICDHINGNRLDNRRENLRITDAFGNGQNLFRCGKFRGSRLLPSGKWGSVVNHKGKSYYVGTFSSREDAAEAARIKREELGFLTSNPQTK